jgi:heptaprenyl diphosphate synthase
LVLVVTAQWLWGEQMKKFSVYKISLTGLFSALATIAFVIENLFPPLLMPGARIGVSNIFILLATVTLGATSGFITLTIKILLGSLFAGNVSSALYSLPAGLISLTLECLLLFKIKNVSLPAISVAGAVINTTVQNTVFCLITKVPEFFFYLPYLALVGVISGLTVGFTVYLIIKKIPNKIWGKI